MKTDAARADINVLVVDDERPVRSVLCDLFALWGTHYRVTAVDSGEAAVAAVTRSRPDVVVLDIVMPGMSGLEALRRMVAIHPDLPVIIMTGLGVEMIPAAEQSGAFACLRKPLNLTYLKHLVDSAAEPAASQEPEPAKSAPAAVTSPAAPHATAPKPAPARPGKRRRGKRAPKRSR